MRRHSKGMMKLLWNLAKHNDNCCGPLKSFVTDEQNMGHLVPTGQQSHNLLRLSIRKVLRKSTSNGTSRHWICPDFNPHNLQKDRFLLFTKFENLPRNFKKLLTTVLVSYTYLNTAFYDLQISNLWHRHKLLGTKFVMSVPYHDNNLLCLVWPKWEYA